MAQEPKALAPKVLAQEPKALAPKVLAQEPKELESKEPRALRNRDPATQAREPATQAREPAIPQVVRRRSQPPEWQEPAQPRQTLLPTMP
jgi:hypothetical protein